MRSLRTGTAPISREPFSSLDPTHGADQQIQPYEPRPDTHGSALQRRATPAALQSVRVSLRERLTIGASVCACLAVEDLSHGDLQSRR